MGHYKRCFPSPFNVEDVFLNPNVYGLTAHSSMSKSEKPYSAWNFTAPLPVVQQAHNAEIQSFFENLGLEFPQTDCQIGDKRKLRTTFPLRGLCERVKKRRHGFPANSQK